MDLYGASQSIGSAVAATTSESLLFDESDEQTDSTAADQLSDIPPLVLISTRVKQYGSLVQSANPGVAAIGYDYDNTSLSRLLQLVGERLKSRKALSIALVVHGQPGLFKLSRHHSVSLESLRTDGSLQSFFNTLISSFLFTSGKLARLDILNNPVEQTADGKQLLKTLSDITKVPVYSSEDIWGAAVEGGEKIGTLYFDSQRLKEWNAANVMKLDKYEKIRTVGQGAYGQAILYRRKEDDSQVILKQINILELNKTERQNVVSEIKILAMLDHPHIISYYDNFEEDGQVMIEMEFADGGSLQQYLKQQTSHLSELEILTKFSQMVDALNFVHKNNILHRDLKTANVFLTRFGIVKLGDFGISKELSATHQAAQTMVGTPYYISPEICEGKLYDAKSDIWSLGCILHEMVCLFRPFDGTNLPALVHKIVEGSFEPIKGKFSDELKKLIQKMLQKEPHRRPSASELYTSIVPPLLRAIQVKEGILQPVELPTVDDKDMKSFLYCLDGQSLLFSPVNCPIQDRIIHVAVGYGHILAVTADTVVYSWGDNRYGQLGHNDREHRSTPTVIAGLQGRNINKAECGGEFSIFKNENGIIMSCGRGDKGVLGHGNYNDCLQPAMIQMLLTHDNHVISCGESHVVILTLDNRVFTWGEGKYGCLGTGSEDNCCTPTEIILRSPGARMDERPLDVRCGMDSTVFITEMGRVFACGNNRDNKIGLNRRETFIMQMRKLLNKHQLQVPFSLKPLPVKELGNHRIIDCSLGSTHSAFLTETGLVYTFGRNRQGQLGSGNCEPREMAAIVKGIRNKPMMVTCSELATIVATESNTFHIWGSRPVIESPLTSLLTAAAATGGGANGSHKSSHESVNSTSRTHLIHSESSEQVDYPSAAQKSTKKPSAVLKRSDEAISRNNRKLSWSYTESIFNEHHTVICQSSTNYISTLYDILVAADDHGPVSRQTSQSSVGGGRGLKKAGSQECCKDIILKPIVIDLVDQKGTLNNLWQQGLKEVKIEGITSFGCNMVLLLHAHIPPQQQTATAQTNNHQQQGKVIIGSRLRRSVVSLASLAPAGIPSRHSVPDPPFPDAVDAPVIPDQRANLISPLSVTEELPTWLKDDLRDGIPLQQSIAQSVNVSHGWYPESLRGHGPLKQHCWSDDNVETVPADIEPLNKVPPRILTAKRPNTSSSSSSGMKGVQPSSVQRMESIIPDTILESNELSISQSDKESIVNDAPTSASPNVSSSVAAAASRPPLKSAKSINHIPPVPTPTQLNIKRVQSSDSITVTRAGPQSTVKRIPSSVTANSRRSSDTKRGNGHLSRRPSCEKDQATKFPNDSHIPNNYTTMGSPYAQPLSRHRSLGNNRQRRPPPKQQSQPTTAVAAVSSKEELAIVPSQNSLVDEETERIKREQQEAKEREDELIKKNEELQKRIAELEAAAIPSNDTTDNASEVPTAETRRRSWFRRRNRRTSNNTTAQSSTVCLIL